MFQIEVPPHLAVQLGLRVLAPFTPLVLDCERPVGITPAHECERAKAA